MKFPNKTPLFCEIWWAWGIKNVISMIEILSMLRLIIHKTENMKWKYLLLVNVFIDFSETCREFILFWLFMWAVCLLQMGYGSRALSLLKQYYKGEVVSLSETADAEPQTSVVDDQVHRNTGVVFIYQTAGLVNRCNCYCKSCVLPVNWHPHPLWFISL